MQTDDRADFLHWKSVGITGVPAQMEDRGLGDNLRSPLQGGLGS